MEIKDSVVIITGASQGIGLAAAKLLASKGAKVALAARSQDALEKLEKELPGSLAVPTDLRKEGAVARMIQKTIDHYGRIDILINNAGQGLYGPVASVDLNQYRDVLELNVVSVIAAMQAVIPHMRQQGGGMILNVSSRVSKNYFPNLGAYASTKYALNALSLTAREELRKDNIVVSILLPKMTATNFGKNAFRTEAFQNARPGDARPQPQVDTAEDVAQKIAELIQSEAPELDL